MTERRRRLEALRGRLREAELDGLVVSAPSNVLYLSGFRGSSGALLITDKRAALFSDSRYRLQAREQASGFEFVEVERRLLPAVGAAVSDDRLRRLGYDPANLTCELRDQLAEGASGIELCACGGLVEALRAQKSRDEIRHIRAAAALADRTLAHMVTLLRPGATEREIALAGEFLMRRDGAEAAAFDIIVASGLRSALPHAETTSRALEVGDLVVIDLGARVSGYCSDMTRTFAIGSAPPEAREIYEVAYRAGRAAVAEVRAGAVCSEVDAVARSLIEQAGYGEAFGHGLGHGVGLEVHERPRLARGENNKLAPGNVVTIEPGIYLEGVGGVRLEDLVVVAEGGVERLTGAAMAPELPVV